MGVQMMYIIIQDRKTVKKQGFLQISVISKAILLLWFLFYQGVYDLQILHTTSLVGHDQEKTIAMGVQLTYIMIQDRETVKKHGFFPQISHQRTIILCD